MRFLSALTLVCLLNTFCACQSVQMGGQVSVGGTVGVGPTGAPPCTITTPSLPGAVQNVAYSQTLTSQNCTSPTWVVSAGSPPPGITMNSSGVISGTDTTTTGNYPFTVQISNASPVPSFNLSIAVTAASAAADNRYCNSNETITGLPNDTTGSPVNPPQALQGCTYTLLSAVSASGPTKTVCASGCDFTTLQAAMNAWACGWIVQIKASTNGAQNSYAGGTVPATACPSNNWIIVETDQVASLPAEGSRISPAWMGIPSLHITCPAGSPLPECGRPPYAQPTTAGIYIPQIIGTNNSALTFTSGASHMLWRGLQFTTATGNSQPLTIVNVGGGNDHIWFMQTVGNGGNNANWQSKDNVNKGFNWTGSCNIALTDSYWGEIHQVGNDNNVVFFGGTNTNASCRDKVVDNYLEAAGENIFCGGGGAGSLTVSCTDIEIRRNHFYKPLFWKASDPSYFGTQFTVKNSIESKNGVRWLIEGNIIENDWGQQSDQAGQLVNIGPKNQSSFFTGTASVDANGNITWISDGNSPHGFHAADVSPNCALPNHCMFTFNGTQFVVNTFTDSTHVTIAPNSTYGSTVLPPPTASANYKECVVGLNPSATDTDFTIRFNKFSHASRGIAISADSSDCKDIGLGNFRASVHDNAFDDLDGHRWNLSDGACCAWSIPFVVLDFNLSPNGITDATIVHNTALPSLSCCATGYNGALGPSFFIGRANTPQTNLNVRDNIGPSGFVGPSGISTSATTTLGQFAPGTFCFEGNVMATTTATSGVQSYTANNGPYPIAGASPGCPAGIGNFTAASYDAILFTSLSGANGGNYQLQAGSPYHNAASDGTDPGVNWTALQNAIAGVQ